MQTDKDPAIDTISFDMDGTLTGGRFIELVWGEGIPTLFSREKNMSIEEATAVVLKEYADLGEGRPEWYDVKYWFKLFGLGSEWMALLKSFAHEIAIFPEVPDVLTLLRQHYRLVVISNATHEFIEIELGVTQLRDSFDAVFSSTSDFGKVKKTPEVYEGVCRMLGVKPESVAHVGDHELFDFSVPRQLGIRSYYLDRAAHAAGDHVVHNLQDFVQKLEFER